MADLIVAHFNEFIAAASLDPRSDGHVDRANEVAPYAPHGVYPTSDGWLALSVADDDQFARLAGILPLDEPAPDPDLTRAAGRFERRRLLDERIAAATQARAAHDLAAALRDAGIAAEKALTPADLLTSPQLTSREFFTTVTHPEWGRRRLVGIPWRPFGGPPLALGSPPQLTPLGDDRS
jgi:crotonobetainyl-CoA:carnitine CoA-transferase CaiB-like acyl-CoA transferase